MTAVYRLLYPPPHLPTLPSSVNTAPLPHNDCFVLRQPSGITERSRHFVGRGRERSGGEEGGEGGEKGVGESGGGGIKYGHQTFVVCEYPEGFPH